MSPNGNLIAMTVQTTERAVDARRAAAVAPRARDPRPAHRTPARAHQRDGVRGGLAGLCLQRVELAAGGRDVLRNRHQGVGPRTDRPGWAADLRGGELAWIAFDPDGRNRDRIVERSRSTPARSRYRSRGDPEREHQGRADGRVQPERPVPGERRARPHRPHLRRPLARELRVIAQPDAADGVAFTADGRNVLSWDTENTVRVWDACTDCESPRALLALASARVTRALTPQERASSGSTDACHRADQQGASAEWLARRCPGAGAAGGASLGVRPRGARAGRAPGAISAANIAPCSRWRGRAPPTRPRAASRNTGSQEFPTRTSARCERGSPRMSRSPPTAASAVAWRPGRHPVLRDLHADRRLLPGDQRRHPVARCRLRREVARAGRTVLELVAGDGATPITQAATEAEAHLLRRRPERCRRRAPARCGSHDGDYGALATTRQQLRLICDLLDIDHAFLARARRPGGRPLLRAPDRGTSASRRRRGARSPHGSTDAVRDAAGRIRVRLAGRGPDILWAEAMLAAGASFTSCSRSPARSSSRGRSAGRPRLGRRGSTAAWRRPPRSATRPTTRSSATTSSSATAASWRWGSRCYEPATSTPTCASSRSGTAARRRSGRNGDRRGDVAPRRAHR